MNCDQAAANHHACFLNCVNTGAPTTCFDQCANQLCGNATPACAITADPPVQCSSAYAGVHLPSFVTSHQNWFIIGGVVLLVLIILAVLGFIVIKRKK